MAKKTKKKKAEKIQPEVKLTRNTLMLQAKERGIKNFRVLNKDELMHVLAEGITQQEIDALVAGAVTRWKSGWGKGKARTKAR